MERLPEFSETLIPMRDEIKLAMADVILEFARLDANLLALVFVSYEIEPSEGSILLGYVDVVDKVRMLQRLAYHRNDERGKVGYRRLKVRLEKYLERRNIICHTSCIGLLEKEPDVAAFLSLNAVKGVPRRFKMYMISKNQMLGDAAWARRMANVVYELQATMSERP